MIISLCADRDRDAHCLAPLPHHRTYGSRIRRFGWSKQTQIKLWVCWALENDTLPDFSICCTVPVRIRSLTATTIYPDHSVGDRSGLRRGETSAYYSNAARYHRLLCPPVFALRATPRHAADFCHAIVSPYGSLSPYGRAADLPGVNTYLSTHECRVYMSGLKWIEDFAVCCPPAADHHQARLTRFLFIAPCVCGTLPQQGGFLPEHHRRYPVAMPL